MSYMRKSIFFLLSSILLTACVGGGSNIKDMSMFDKRPLVKADIMPTKAQISGAKTRVVVFGIDDSSTAIGKKAKIGTSISNKIESLVSNAGAEIIDRNLALKLQKEIELSELKGKRDYKGPEIADFSITGKIVTTDFTQKYTAVSVWTDKKGQRHARPAKCQYKVSVEATLKVHALPSLRLVDTITITDTESKSQELSYALFTDQKCPEYTDAQISSLVTAAGADAVQESKVQIKSNFSPRGYITEHRVDKDNKNIFKITIGKQAGIEEGMKIDVVQMFNDENALTGETNLEERKLSEGIVSNILGDKFAWVIIDNVEKIRKIRLGDVVKVRFEDSFMDSFKKMF